MFLVRLKIMHITEEFDPVNTPSVNHTAQIRACMLIYGLIVHSFDLLLSVICYAQWRAWMSQSISTFNALSYILKDDLHLDMENEWSTEFWESESSVFIITQTLHCI